MRVDLLEFELIREPSKFFREVRLMIGLFLSKRLCAMNSETRL